MTADTSPSAADASDAGALVEEPLAAIFERDELVATERLLTRQDADARAVGSHAARQRIPEIFTVVIHGAGGIGEVLAVETIGVSQVTGPTFLAGARREARTDLVGASRSLVGGGGAGSTLTLSRRSRIRRNARVEADEASVGAGIARTLMRQMAPDDTHEQESDTHEPASRQDLCACMDQCRPTLPRSVGLRWVPVTENACIPSQSATLGE